ncbi:ricin B-like lectin EULS3 [Hibiscus syriacus]|uniref:ricin B-like lectin EULS3 n=1 Tax=Hibiscus syriacus TaxID=106335 RepID=UPI001923B378|nr:ricin B-like lectin EULS3 [Hibiscus syriacus]
MCFLAVSALPPPPNYHQPPAFDGPYPPPPPSLYFQQPAFDGPTPFIELLYTNTTHNKPTVKIYCKAGPSYHLTIRDGKVVLAPSDPSDEFQHWYKDEKFSTRVKDEVGFPSFSLANKATGQVIKHSIGASHPVQLVPYKPDLDESVLWSESKEVHDGYRAIRMINNIRLNLDAFHGDKKFGGIHNGIPCVVAMEQGR